MPNDFHRPEPTFQGVELALRSALDARLHQMEGRKLMKEAPSVVVIRIAKVAKTAGFNSVRLRSGRHASRLGQYKGVGIGACFARIYVWLANFLLFNGS